MIDVKIVQACKILAIFLIYKFLLLFFLQHLLVNTRLRLYITMSTQIRSGGGGIGRNVKKNNTTNVGIDKKADNSKSDKDKIQFKVCILLIYSFKTGRITFRRVFIKLVHR